MASGDPQLVAAPVFTIGSIALAFQLVEYVSPAALGAPLAVVLMCTGLFLVVSTIWAAAAGQSFVACFAGTFGGFWLAYGVLVLALLHNWFADPGRRRAADRGGVRHLVRVVLLLPHPGQHPAADHLHGDLRAGRGHAVLRGGRLPDDAREQQPAPPAGYITFVFAGLGMWLSWTVMNLSLGGPASRRWPGDRRSRLRRAHRTHPARAEGNRAAVRLERRSSAPPQRAIDGAGTP